MIRRFLLLFISVTLVLSISGVYATWLYAQGSPTPKETAMSVSLEVFDYPPEQVLPGGDTEDVELGQNHFALIEIILNEKDKSYGININSSGVLNSYLKKQSVVFSNQKVSGGNLKFVLDPKNNTHGLYYCLEKVDEQLIYAYTFSVSELSTAAGSDIEITVYRTSLEKTDIWRATTSYLGYAKVKSLSDMDVSADPNTLSYSIDVTSWHL